MKINYSLKNHFSHSFFIYLAALVIVPLLCSYSIQLKTRPKDYEKFSFFSEALLSDEKLLNDQLSKVLPEDLIINFYYMDRSDNVFNTYLSSYGLNSDICLLSETTLSKFESVPFLDLKETVWNNVDNYVIGDLSIGILIKKDTLSALFSFKEEKYYFCVIKESVHLKGLKNNGQTDQVNRVLEYLTTYE